MSHDGNLQLMRRSIARRATCALIVLGGGPPLAGCGAETNKVGEAAIMAEQKQRFIAEARESGGWSADLAEATPAFGTQGWVIEKNKWPSPNIDVCWEQMPPETAAERAWVVDALAKAWEAHSAVDFRNWTQCASNTPNSIRVAVSDEVPRTVGIGWTVRGRREGVRLNFSFGTYKQSLCQNAQNRESCIRATAVHEFGHAIGFVHEHNRHDTPSSCTEDTSGADGTLILTPGWDAESVMNYCAPNRLLNRGRLSPGDETSVEAFYGNEI